MGDESVIRHSVKFAVAVCTVILIASCSGPSVLRAVLPTPTAAEVDAAKDMIASYCTAQSGTVINRTVKRVYGFVYRTTTIYDNGFNNPATSGGHWGCGPECLDFLLSGFDYVEAKLRVPPGRSEAEWDFVGSPGGYYRYQLVNRKEHDCSRFDRMVERNGALQAATRSYPQLMAGKCVVGLAIPTLEARYKFEPYIALLEMSDNGTYISTSGSRVLDQKNNELLAISSWPLARNISYGRTVLATCGYEQPALILSDVLHPTG